MTLQHDQRIDSSLPLRSVCIALLTVSDTRDHNSDRSGDLLAARITKAGHQMIDRQIVTDNIEKIRHIVCAWIEAPAVEAIITTGGTGFAPQDVTPEAIEPLFEKKMNGFATIFHQMSYRKIGLSTLQSRSTAGFANGTFIFCLPGSPSAVQDGWDQILSWQLDSRYRPCNLTELISPSHESDSPP